MKIAKQIVLIITLCISQLFIRCSTDDNKVNEEKTGKESYTEEISFLRNYISTSTGIDLKKIIYDSKQSFFIIDGDVTMSLEEARQRYNDSKSRLTNKTHQMETHQMETGYRMSLQASATIKVYISSEVPQEWRAAIGQAVNNWNYINSNINLTLVDSEGTATTIISMYTDTASRAIAYAQYPNDGKPGSYMKINTSYNNISPSRKVFVVTHEFGHNFGLDHTNNGSRLIDCTPTVDEASIMNSVVSEWTKFSPYDNIAISTLYPVAEGAKKLYRFKKNGYYFYTTNPCEISHGKDGYVYDGDLGYLYTMQVPETIPLYRVLNGTIDKGHQMYTRITETSNAVILGYLYPYKKTSTTALYTTLFPRYNLYQLENEDVNTTTGFVLHKFLNNKEVGLIF